jgi:hypothetical protein
VVKLAYTDANVMKMWGDRRLLTLAIVHFVFGLVAGMIARIGLPTPLPLDILLIIVSGLCQAFLLSLWAVTATASRWKRIAGLVTGAVYLEILLGFTVGRDFAGIATITIAATAASLLVVRVKGWRFIRQVAPQSVIEPMRFSIRSLMLLIAAAALLITVARALDEIPMPRKTLPLNIFFSLCIATVGLFAVWAVLAATQPWRRGSIVLILSPVLGVLFAIAASATYGGWVLIILTMTLYSVTMLGSFLIVRFCGYRFVRGDSPLLKQQSGEGNVGGSLPV